MVISCMVTSITQCTLLIAQWWVGHYIVNWINIVPLTSIFIGMLKLVTLLSKVNRASVVPSTYQQARCSGVHPSVSVQVGLHFRSSIRYLARGRCPFLKSRVKVKSSFINHVIYSTIHNCDDCDSKFVFMYKSVPAHMVLTILLPPTMHGQSTLTTLGFLPHA